MERSLLHRLFNSLPIIGPAMGVFIEHTEMGIAQFGAFLGILRGAVVGLIIAAVLIALSETVIAAFDVGREWISVNYTSVWKAGIRGKVLDDQTQAELESYQKGQRPNQAVPLPTSGRESVCSIESPVAGCFWVKLRYHDKAAFVVGVHDTIHKNHDGQNLFPVGTYADIVTRLDVFYQDPAHKTTPVVDAIEGVQ